MSHITIKLPQTLSNSIDIIFDPKLGVGKEEEKQSPINSLKQHIIFFKTAHHRPI